MALLDIKTFSGLVPKHHPTALRLGWGTTAHNINLRHGTLKPWREPLTVHTAAADTQTVTLWGCCWREWATCVDTAYWKRDCDRLFATGAQAYPIVYNLKADCTSECGGREWTRVGVPMPTTAPTAQPMVVASETETTELRNYIYRYVNCLGETGVPSYPSNDFWVDDGVGVMVSGFETPPSEWGIVSVEIFRLASGFTTEREQVEEQVTEWLYVDTIPVGQASYLDSMQNKYLGPAADSQMMQPPPANMRFITAVPNGTVLVGAFGKQVCFSSCNQPWSWPEAQQLSLHDSVVGLAATDGTVYVATNGAPYTISTASDCAEAACRAVVRHADSLPMVACCSGRGMIATPLGAFYVSSHGIVMLNGNARPVVVTSAWFTTDDWRLLKPETMRLGWAEGCLFIASDVRTYVLFLDAPVFGDHETARLTTIDDQPKHFLTGRNGELFLLNGTEVQQWDAGLQHRPFIWEQVRIESAQKEHYSTCRVGCEDSTEVTVSASGRQVWQRTVVNDPTVRLPHYGHHRYHSVKLTGVWEVYNLQLASTRRDLVRRG